MVIESIRNALTLCVIALKSLHPEMEEDIVREAYIAAKYELDNLKKVDDVT